MPGVYNTVIVNVCDCSPVTMAVALGECQVVVKHAEDDQLRGPVCNAAESARKGSPAAGICMAVRTDAEAHLSLPADCTGAPVV